MSETTHTAYIHCSLSWTAVNYMFWNLNFVWMWTRSTVKLDTSWLELMQQIVYWRCMLISTHSTYLLFVRFTLNSRCRLHTRYMKYNTYTCMCKDWLATCVYWTLWTYGTSLHKSWLQCVQRCCTLQLLYSVSASASFSQLSRHCTCMEKHIELMCAVLLKTIGSAYVHCIGLTND